MNRFFLLALGSVILFSCAPQKALFTVEQKTHRLPEKVQFQNMAPVADRYEWDFGDGSRSTEKNPTHLYTKSGIYQVTLKSFKKNKMTSSQQKLELLPPEGCYVAIETPMGNMIARLYDQTPQHRDNFFKHCEQGFYDDLLFHRVIQGFMVQGGDPNSRNAGPGAMLGSGGPGYTVPAEFNAQLIHKKGALAAARTGDQVNPKKASSGSQFYIVQGGPQTDAMLDQIEDRKGMRYTPEQREIYKSLGGTPFLDGDYTVFGEIIEGLEVIDKIAAVKTERGDRPSENITMKIKALH
ncbi:MAG TPA: peptidylprolyl isomerase [Saprospiraceae bacterium]|nr:peptidylprolyl isomerase [Saprospiraceae bacterium]